jgi:hypothetical protein
MVVTDYVQILALGLVAGRFSHKAETEYLDAMRVGTDGDLSGPGMDGNAPGTHVRIFRKCGGNINVMMAADFVCNLARPVTENISIVTGDNDHLVMSQQSNSYAINVVGPATVQVSSEICHVWRFQDKQWSYVEVAL